MSQRIAVALSEHPAAAEAAGQVIGEIIERVGAEPDLAVLVLSRHHGSSARQIASAVRNVVRPKVLVGVTASSVVGGAREVEDQPAISLWVGRIGTCRGIRLVTERFADARPEFAVLGVPPDAADANAAILLGDPFSFDAEAALAAFKEIAPGLPIVGGLASASTRPGGNQIILDDQVFDDGALAVLLEGEAVPEQVVSQGCRPIGEPLIVTRADGNLVHELGGVPALDRLTALAASLPEAEQALMQQGVHIGRVVDEHQTAFARGDFLIRTVIGGDRTTGSLAIGDEPQVGSTLQFHVRDASTADADLRALMSTKSASGALLFTCNGRGSRMFDEQGHDASIVASRTDCSAVGGFGCAGEIGPVGRANYVHGFTASALLFA